MEPVDFLRELVEIPSPSGEEQLVADYLCERMERIGFRVKRDEVGNVIGAVGDPRATRTIVLLGHMDTVPGDIPVRVSGGRLFGRGTIDAKGPLAALVLAAAEAADRLGETKVHVIGAVEEEAHGRGARFLAKNVDAPFCAIIGEPSSWQGVTLGYKGMLSVDYRFTQPSAHSAGDESGPAEKAVFFWNQLMTYADDLNGGRSGHFDTVDPALRRFSTFSDGLDDGVIMNIVTRLPRGTTASELRSKMNVWCNGAQLQFHPSDPPYVGEKNTALVRSMLSAIRKAGGKPRFKLKTGTSDMNIVGPAWECPMVAYGPGDSSLDHTPDEHIEVAEYLRTIDVLTHTLTTLAS